MSARVVAAGTTPRDSRSSSCLVLSTAIFFGWALTVVLPSKCVTVRGKAPSVSRSEPMPSARVFGAAEGPSEAFPEAPSTGFRSAFPVVPPVSEDEQPASSPPTTTEARTACTAAVRTTPPVVPGSR